jgi:hypothetical protein
VPHALATKLRACQGITFTLCCRPPGPLARRARRAYPRWYVRSAQRSQRAWGPQPEGARRRAGICCVAAPRRCTPASPASRRLASARPTLAPKCKRYSLTGPNHPNFAIPSQRTVFSSSGPVGSAGRQRCARLVISKVHVAQQTPERQSPFESHRQRQWFTLKELRVPHKQPKWDRLWFNIGLWVRLRAGWPNHWLARRLWCSLLHLLFV